MPVWVTTQELVGRDHISQQTVGYAWGQNVLRVETPILSRSTAKTVQ